MSRWNIRGVFFFSHDGRRTEVAFDIEAVNIVTGVSYSGKSALVEVLDYCMGAGECHVPGIVREACSWVAVLWAKDETEAFVARRIPPLSKQTSEEVVFRVGKRLTIPQSASELLDTTNRTAAMKQFEQLLGIGDVKGETFNESRSGVRISFRNAVPFLIQSDDVIINKVTLLRGANDERRLHIIEALPYFLGAVDEDGISEEARLKRLQSQLDRLQRQLGEAERLATSEIGRVRSLVLEAVQARLVEEPPQNASLEQLQAVLSGIAGWMPTPVVASGADHLTELYRSERRLISNIARIRSQASAAEEALDSATEFEKAAEGQRRRLDVLKLIRDDSGRDVCPLCQSDIQHKAAHIDAIQDAFAQLDIELKGVRTERPKLDGFIEECKNQIVNESNELTSVREQIAALVRSSETLTEQINLDQQRNRVVGRISLFLENREIVSDAAIRQKMHGLEDEISQLESSVNPEAKREALQAVQLQVSAHATTLLKKLPFDENYRDGILDFDPRTLNAGYVTDVRVMQMRDIGSDESYLSIHVAILLALHRVFAIRQRPVPGVMLFDQLSRPFFPPDEQPEEVLITESDLESGANTDRRDLKRYFDVLFDEVGRKDPPQIIVLEHAYFADDQRFVKAVKKRWTHSDKLIPPDWPRSES